MKKIIALTTFLILLIISCYSQNIIESNNRFAFDFYKNIQSKSENIIFSPASISSAFAMTYAGSNNNTFNEISEVFYFEKNLKVFNSDYYNLINLKSNSKSVSLNNANSIWFEKDLKLNSEYLSTNKQYYNSSSNFADFKNNSEKSRLQINSWVEKNTNGKIKDLLSSSSIDNSTKLVLVNALYFKGDWKTKFKKENNTTGDFQVSKRSKLNTTFMNSKINSWYYEDKYAQIIEIPYSDRSTSLMIIIPKSFRKIKKLNKKFNYGYYQTYISNKQKKKIDLLIPKFKVLSEYNLVKNLKKLGIKDAFAGNADFSGICSNEHLFISDAIHKAIIEIDENGTEAAAATAVVMRKTSILLDSVKVTIDKPFIYILRNNENNCIYFMGKVFNPN
jgi:serpin B